MAVAWPADFPCPLRDGYSYTLANLNQETSFANGERVRPLYEDGSDSFQLTVYLTKYEWEYIQGWFRYEAKNGAEWVLMPIRTGSAVELREVRIRGPLTFSLVPDSDCDVRVPMSVKSRVGTTISLDYYNYLKELGGADAAGKFADLLAYAMNKQIPSFAEEM